MSHNFKSSTIIYSLYGCAFFSLKFQTFELLRKRLRKILKVNAFVFSKPSLHSLSSIILSFFSTQFQSFEFCCKELCNLLKLKYVSSWCLLAVRNKCHHGSYNCPLLQSFELKLLHPVIYLND